MVPSPGLQRKIYWLGKKECLEFFAPMRPALRVCARRAVALDPRRQLTIILILLHSRGRKYINNFAILRYLRICPYYHASNSKLAIVFGHAADWRATIRRPAHATALDKNADKKSGLPSRNGMDKSIDESRGHCEC